MVGLGGGGRGRGVSSCSASGRVLRRRPLPWLPQHLFVHHHSANNKNGMTNTSRGTEKRSQVFAAKPRRESCNVAATANCELLPFLATVGRSSTGFEELLGRFSGHESDLRARSPITPKRISGSWMRWDHRVYVRAVECTCVYVPTGTGSV